VVALVLVLTFVVVLLGILVAGLLRSHADILKALHDLGAGVGDPAATDMEGADHRHEHGGVSPLGAPVTMGPRLPAERSSQSAPAITGVTPTGDAVGISLTDRSPLTLIAFLSTGCATCAGFWEAFQDSDRLGLPSGMRLVVVTKGPELEIPAEVQAKARSRCQVIMSTDAWRDYEVPGSPFFVLVDGAAQRRIGEGVANHMSQVVDLVRRAQGDTVTATPAPRVAADTGATSLNGPARESANDEALLEAGIGPGHPSLYPSSLEDVFPDRSAAEHQRPRHPAPSAP
jgi:hypothetical protein